MEEFEQFVRARAAALLRTAYLLTGDAGAAEDLLQEALARAAERWSRVLQHPGGVEAYVRRTLVTCSVDGWRRRRVRSNAELTSVARASWPTEPDLDIRLDLRRDVAHPRRARQQPRLARRAPQPQDLGVDLAATAWAIGRRRRTRRRVRVGSITAAAVAAGVLAVPVVQDLVLPPSTPTVDGPVITTAEKWDAVPTAGIYGALTLRQGCLLIGGSPVFWSKGTTWDPTRRAVVFDDGRRVAVGQRFSGGGGVYDVNTAQLSVTRDDAATARLVQCARAASSGAVLFAYPD